MVDSISTRMSRSAPSGASYFPSRSSAFARLAASSGSARTPLRIARRAWRAAATSGFTALQLRSQA